jgi:hypothetical protein
MNILIQRVRQFGIIDISKHSTVFPIFPSYENSFTRVIIDRINIAIAKVKARTLNKT